MKFSILIWTRDTSADYFRETLGSLAEQTHRNFEIYVLDENRDDRVRRICGERFPRDPRMICHKLKNARGAAYAFNAALHRAEGEYVLFLGQHDRISDNALELLAEEIAENAPASDIAPVDFITFDNDELIGINRMNPQFKPGINVELLRHTNYIGDCYAVRKETFRRIGLFNTSLKSAQMYEFLLRGVERRCRFIHIPRLLYHQRIHGDSVSLNPDLQRIQRIIYREHMTVCAAHLHRMGVTAQLKPHRDLRYWKVMYEGEYKRRRSDFYVIRGEGVRVHSREKALNRMHGILRQPDVGIVGVRFDQSPFLIDNAGYIFDGDGIAYPACHNHSNRGISYFDRNILTVDVSMVDPAFFIIDAEVFKRIGGINRRLSGLAQMLDLCLRVRRARRRVVCDVMSVAHKKRGTGAFEEDRSNTLLADLWGETLKRGDPFYNRNLPMGLENYMLY